MNECEKSDRLVVPVKVPNNAASAVAEVLEGKGLREGNRGQQNAFRTQSQIWRAECAGRLRRIAGVRGSTPDPSEEPSAVVPHAGICAGGGSNPQGEGPSLPRPLENRKAKRDGEPARVVEYKLEDPALTEAEQSYRLITTILEPDAAPASELAALYPQRWELESALDELKTHQRGPRVVLRSKAPDGVYQEAYGHLCTHYAIRRMMHDAALRADLVPHRLSFWFASRC